MKATVQFDIRCMDGDTADDIARYYAAHHEMYSTAYEQVGPVRVSIDPGEGQGTPEPADASGGNVAQSSPVSGWTHSERGAVWDGPVIVNPLSMNPRDVPAGGKVW